MARMNWPEILRRCRAAGLTVVEIPGWKSRGRPGRHDPVGLVVHHTGGTPDSRDYINWMALEGRPTEGIPAPLAQLGLSRKGVVYMMAAGRANQAGKCRAVGGWLKAGDGNAQTVGIEAMNTGKEGWDTQQYRAYVTLSAIICDVQGWPASRVVAHRETSTTGKWDPGLLDMPRFRADIAAAIKGGTPTEEDDPMAGITLEDIKQQAANGVAHALMNSEQTRDAFLELLRKSYLSDQLRSVAELVIEMHRRNVAGVLAAVKTVPGVDVDDLAAKLADAIPEQSAQDIVDELHARLAE